MQVSTSCPHCATRFQVAKTIIGKRTRCTKCGQPFVLAESSPVSAAKRSVSNIKSEPIIENDLAQNTPPPPPLVSPIELVSEPKHDPVSRFETDHENQHGAPTLRRFLALRIVAGILEALAVLILIGALFSITVDCVEYSETSEIDGLRQAKLVRDIVQVVIGGMLSILFLLFIANIIRLGLQIERNTYRSQELLQRFSSSRKSD